MVQQGAFATAFRALNTDVVWTLGMQNGSLPGTLDPLEATL